jgi:5-(carboxyamino)imidazole ribonucleotide mutase
LPVVGRIINLNVSEGDTMPNRGEPGELRVGIIMGSDSDRTTMREAGRALTLLGLKETVDYEARVVSAHRTPDWLETYAKSAEERGLHIIIAGAGGSGHLPGEAASMSLLPVLAVAVTDNPDVMNRALGSMIGMPEGIPLPVFQGKAGAFNAGLCAVRMMALHDPELREAYLAYQRPHLLAPVYGKDDIMKAVGMGKAYDEALETDYEDAFAINLRLVEQGIPHQV